MGKDYVHHVHIEDQQQMSAPIAVSLFSGLGGIDIGLHQAGIKTAVCVEQDPEAAQSLQANSTEHQDHPLSSEDLITKRYPWKVIEDDIYEVSTEAILKAGGVEAEDVDLVVGGPPCQTFSRSNEGAREGTDASRGMLFEEYARVLNETQPRAFIFENVRGLASSNGGEDLKIIKEELSSAGYSLNEKVLNTADYGVPQTRERIFIIGLRSGDRPHFPDPTHVEAEVTLTGKPTWISASEALSDFDLDAFIESERGYLNAVGGKYGYLLKDIPPGANYQHFSERRYDSEQGEYVERDDSEHEEKVFDWRSRHWNYLLKQDPDRPTWTLQADPGTYVGPFHWRSRPYSLLEQMRLMDIPTDYYVAGSPRNIQRQIGNAVPPGIIETLATHLLKQTESEPPTTSSHSRPTPDGGQNADTDYRQSFEIRNGTSPWIHAEELSWALKDGNEVEIWAQGSKISNVIDVAELVRRRLSRPLEINLEPDTAEPDKSKSDVLSILSATVTPT